MASSSPPPAPSVGPRRRPLPLALVLHIRHARYLPLGFAFGSLLAVLGVVTAFGPHVVGAFMFAAGLAWAASALFRSAASSAVGDLVQSYQLICLGRFDDARVKLRAADATLGMSWVARIATVQRAVIALRIGDMQAARTALDAALALPLGWYARANARYQIEGAHALRAFASASLGDHAAAREDIAWVRAQKASSPAALARASLAEVIVLEGEGDRDALAAVLRRDETLLLEHSHPRERAIVRALERMLRAKRPGVYRQLPKRELEDAEPPLQEWVARVVPAAAPFVRVPRGSSVARAGDEGKAPDVTARGRRDAIAARAAMTPRSKAGRWIGIGGAAVAGGVALWKGLLWLMTASVSKSTPELTAQLDMTVFTVIASFLLAAGACGALAVWARRIRKERAAARTLASAVARHGAVDANALERAAVSPNDHAAATACELLAERAERRGDMEAALEASSRGLGRLAGGAGRTAAGAALGYELGSLRAFALAVLGHQEQAAAELGALPESYANRARAVFRARLVEFARSGHYGDGAAWVDQHELDLPLSVREELLADLLRAVGSDVGPDEVTRLKDELRSGANRRWIEAVAPKLLEAFEVGETVLASAPAGETAAEREAIADEEADECSGLAVRVV